MKLEDLKKNYGIFAKKYKLPDFKELNEDFEIEKIDKDSEYLLRLIRKSIMEKIVNSMNFLEMLLNPMNAPRMYHAYLKSMTLEDRKMIEKIYSTLADMILFSLDLEIGYSEEKEAELIKFVSWKWNEIKPGFGKVLMNIKKPSMPNKKEKSYFG